MLALKAYENAHICPVCGMDIDFCHDEHKVRSVFSGAGVEQCFVGQMREHAMKKFADSGVVDAPNSLTTSLTATRTKTE